MSTDGSFSRDVPGDLPAGLAPGSPFRGSAARAAGLVSAGVLRGPRFRRLYPDVYLASDVEVTLALRARGAYLLVVGRGAVGGFAAAELLGASCGPEDAPVDLVVPGRAYRTHPGLTIHRGLLVPDEITTVDIEPVNIGAGRGPVPRSGPVEHVVVTAARRTAYDLACRLPLVDAVVAVDALANAHRFEPAAIGGLRQRHLGARGSAHLTEVIRLANRLSDSPMETRIRLVIVFDGLPVPVLQHPVGPYFLDMAYPAIRLAVEYDGQAHRSQQRALRDLTRQAYLSSRGWKILRFTAVQVLRRPWEVAAEVRSELIRAARRHGSVSTRSTCTDPLTRTSPLDGQHPRHPRGPRTFTAVRLGLVGYGVGGRYFHAPFVVAAQDVELAGVVTRSPDRRAELAADHPGVPAYDSLADLLAAGVDAVTITTPPHTRRTLVLQAIDAGVPTIADKPFAPDAQGGRELVSAAEKAGVPLNVFHNRRWDADIQTLAAVLESAELGELWSVESRMDQANAATLEVGPDAGLLRDLGSHLVDQMLWLLGPARTVYAELDHIEPAGGRTDCRFALSLTHADGMRSRVSASKINFLEDRELRAYGSAGSYVAHGTDVQAQAVFAGRRPVDEGDSWGYDAPEHWGTLHTAAGSRPVPSERGAYQDYYTRFAAALRGDGDFPVPAAQAVDTLEVLDAARISAAENRVVDLPSP